jgi:hypothetical protein
MEVVSVVPKGRPVSNLLPNWIDAFEVYVKASVEVRCPVIWLLSGGLCVRFYDCKGVVCSEL